MSFENDKLNRKKYADYLTEIIGNVQKLLCFVMWKV